MSRILCGVMILLLTVSVLSGTAFLGPPIDETCELPTRADVDDLNVTVNSPTPGQVFQLYETLTVNATVENLGNTWVNGSFNVTLTVVNLANHFHSHNDRFQVDNLGKPGNKTSFNFSGWGGLFQAGDYKVNVTIQRYDGNLTNNSYEFEITVESSTPTSEISLSSPSVGPVLGTVDTKFTFTVTYTYPMFPDTIEIVLNGEAYPLEQSEVSDLETADGKDYEYSTKFSNVGRQSYYFRAVSDKNSTSTATAHSPWVNCTLDDPSVWPTSANVTSIYNFTVVYGDYHNIPNPKITLNINSKTFPYKQLVKNDKDYSDANNIFFCRIFGYQIGLGPFKYTISLDNGQDTLTVGPFNFTGASTNNGSIQGYILDPENNPLNNVEVRLEPLNYFTTTNIQGHYKLNVPTGHNYKLLFHKDSYYNVSLADISVHNNSIIYGNTTLYPLPVGGSVFGRLTDSITGAGLSNIKVEANYYLGYQMTYTNNSGYYTFWGIPEQGGVNISATNDFYIKQFKLLNVFEQRTSYCNMSMVEKGPAIKIIPEPGRMDLNVSTTFVIDFAQPVNVSGFNASIICDKGSINYSSYYNNESYSISITPVDDLEYSTSYTLILHKTKVRENHKAYLWRDFKFQFGTTFKRIEFMGVCPEENSDTVKINDTLCISMDVLLDPKTVNITLVEKSGVLIPLDLNITYWSDMSGLEFTNITAHPKTSFEYNTIYEATLMGGLKDLQGNDLGARNFSWNFKTIKELDSDNDGVPDAKDVFPSDPLEWADSDLDGVGDNKDAFPLDPTEFSDLDGDGIGDFSDVDRDGDGMPNTWEIENLLNPDIQDGNLDADDDGYTNFEEYQRLSDPQNPNDPPSDSDQRTDTYTIITLIIVSILAVIVLVVVFILLRSRSDVRELEEEVEEEERLTADPEEIEQSREQEEEEILDEAESGALIDQEDPMDDDVELSEEGLPEEMEADDIDDDIPDDMQDPLEQEGEPMEEEDEEL